MRRSFKRESNLRAFRWDLGILENFIKEILSDFPSGKPRISISISRPGEELSFKSVQEIRDCNYLPASISNLRISITDTFEEQFIYFSIYSGFLEMPYVLAEGLSEAWCAGIVEKTKSFTRSLQAWYWFLRSWMFLCLGFAVAVFLPTVVMNREKFGISIAAIITLLIFGFITLYLFICYKQIFLPMVLILREEKSWIKEHATELTVGAAIVSALAALYTAFK